MAVTMSVTQHPQSTASSSNVSEPPRAPKVEIVVSTPTVIKAPAIFFGVILVYIARDALLSIVLACVFVLGLDPPVAALERDLSRVKRGYGWR